MQHPKADNLRESSLWLRDVLSAAPHRLLFFVGATQVLAAMTWWTLWLIDARWQGLNLPLSPVPAGWLHAIIMQYQLLPPFMFGFLLTVFPRWMNLAPLTRWHYLPVAVFFFLGQALTLTGALGSLPLLQAGVACTLAGWGVGLVHLGRLLLSEAGRTWHALSCFAALCIGMSGLALFLCFLLFLDAQLLYVALQLGGATFLLPIFFTVCHRMIPFFTGAVYGDYPLYRPLWTLAAFWLLLLMHTILTLLHGYALLWMPDLAIVALSAWLLWRWWPRAARRPLLLLVLFAAFAWLPIAFSLFAAQSIWYQWKGEFILGRAPAHALFIGFFSSMLVAMVTRVTQGHSGRPLQLGRVAGFAFILVQAVSILRVAAETLPDSRAWFAVAGTGWLIAFLPWVVRSAWIFLTPRIDGAAG